MTPDLGAEMPLPPRPKTVAGRFRQWLSLRLLITAVRLDTRLVYSFTGRAFLAQGWRRYGYPFGKWDHRRYDA